MADGLVQALVGNILSLVEKEGSSIIGVRSEFNEIKRELESMISFLKDAERMKLTGEVVKTRVKQVRDMVYDVEDIIDEFRYLMNSQRKRSKFKNAIVQTAKLPKNTWVKHEMAKRLQEINKKIKEIPERRKRYDCNSTEESHTSSSRRSQHQLGPFPFIEGDSVLGFEKHEKILTKWLLDEEPECTVISVVGMGGSGKTTLVTKVYNAEIEKKSFSCYAWVTVSQAASNVENLLRSMIKEFMVNKKMGLDDLITTNYCQLVETTKSMDYSHLVKTLRNHLEKQRYVIVLDDIWDINDNLWLKISSALPRNKHRSRVLLTTRKENIANFSFERRKHIYYLEHLPKEAAWDLFCRKAFSADKGCPEQLEQTARALAEKCNGLPLAIIAMGSLMHSKGVMEQEWSEVIESLNSELSNNPLLEPVKSILSLSFSDLPYYLKHCFLYCCLFPEDYVIRRKRLIRLWIAEGFVEKRENKTLEKVADSYLTDLINRNMLQVVRKNNNGRPKECRMHDVMREVGLSISKEHNFLVLDNNNDGRPRRLAVHKVNDHIQSGSQMSQLRSLLVFSATADDGAISHQSLLNTLLPKFRLLRVLDLQGVPIKTVPNEVTSLFNLQCLNLRKTLITELPYPFGHLINLLTLDISDTEVKVLPGDIVNLKNLRHLIMYHYNLKNYATFDHLSGTWAPSDIVRLKSLQVLASIEAAEVDMIRKLGELTQLKRFEVTKIRADAGIELCNSIQKMKQLHRLFVMATDENVSLKMDTLEQPPLHLSRVTLVGKLGGIPKWFRSLESLTFLFLKWSRLRDDPIPSIQALSKLQHLTLFNAYDGSRLRFIKGSFPNLKILRLWNLPLLNQVDIEQGAMPNVEDLWLSGSKRLKMIPHGIQHLTKLKELTLEDVSTELVKRLRGEAPDRTKVKHISKINHYWKAGFGWSSENL
ncbi:PREDICTED: disease resistance protein RPM1-like [Nelumbo nucifera]|uniref:Disease resistance protein RPM1-like n=2 Tax=Nelumbo nucifera TaxID=4432 RepID=A0A822ZJI3_NELNU|nr:PREDICTED: disease resistance protein RPM1-like [Nelumbo nucifera]DAD44700.1 TPA_asm: hypothetical protein HUJ06_002930 [Nelumbo nucifera]